MKKGLILSLMLSLFMLFVMTGCGQSGTSGFTAGTYTSSQQGKNGPVEVQVKFSTKKIQSVEILSHEETPGISDPARERIPQAIVASQSLNVDTVAGATYTSNAIINAVADCVEQAGGNLAALQAGGKKTAKAEAKETSCDIVIVGAGAAGLTAALTASDLGADVIVIEKGANAGVSNGANAGGPIAVGTKVQAEAGENLTMETLFGHMAGFAKNTINESLLRKVLGLTGETIDKFSDLGMSIVLFPDSYGVGFRARHRLQDRGNDRMKFLTDAIEANGSKIFYETHGTSLVQDADGTVTGVMASQPGNIELTIHAKVVLLATGGYLGNEEMLHEKFGDININPLGNTLSTGEGIQMAVAAGGSEDRNWGIVANEFSAANKKAGQWSFGSSNQNLRFGIYGGLMVNKDGNRFFNEKEMADNPLCGAEATVRENKYYAVMDAAYFDSVAKIGIFETLGRPASWVAGERNLSAEAPRGAHVKILDKAPEQLQEAIDQGWGYKADTIEDLAAHFGLENLPATVAQYNEYCEAGRDEMFFKDKSFMIPVSEGPFYVFEYEPSAWCTLGGVRVDDSLRVIDDSNNPIPGLYAAGLDAGSLYTSPYYDNEGSAFGIALGSGRLAGKLMAAAVK